MSLAWYSFNAGVTGWTLGLTYMLLLNGRPVAAFLCLVMAGLNIAHRSLVKATKGYA